MSTRGRRPGASVQFKVLIQDQAVINETRSLSAIHPMVVHTLGRFVDGPVSSRVAVIDVDMAKGRLRTPAILIPEAGVYNGVGEYRVRMPQRTGGAVRPQLRGVTTPMTMDELASLSDDEAFIKVSAFGTVLRTIGFVEHPSVLGRRVTWAFDGEQLLVVPLAGTLDNAFYHRPSRSLQFFSFPTPGRTGTVHTALSEDIVTHETTHALIDGIAPDLYGATDPESLGIHEGIADLTAAMLSLRNRELPATMAAAEAVASVVGRSSRYSQIAEEFGRARGQTEALRDAYNKLAFSGAENDRADIADHASPYSCASVLSGTLYAVLSRALSAPVGPGSRAGKGADMFPFRAAVFLATNRIGGMVYRGLDWLPPGDASFAEFIAAILVADRFTSPDGERERRWLVDESARRGIATAAALDEAAQLPTSGLRLPPETPIAGIRAFVRTHREPLGIPAGAKPSIVVRPAGVVERPGRLDEEMKDPVELDRVYRPIQSPAQLIKATWWERRSVDLGSSFPVRCDVKCGATVAIDGDGRVAAVLAGGRHPRRSGRQDFLKRLVDSGSLEAPAAGDHDAQRGGLRAATIGGSLRIDGGLEALHVADAFVD